MNFLIVYGSTHGQTAQIAERIASRLRQLGHQAKVHDASRPLGDLRPADFDGILVGASLHIQSYQRSVRKFVSRNLDALQRRPSAFFAVCMAIASQNANDRETAQRLAHEFPARFDWTPTRVRIFAGALRFSRYNALVRWVMKRISEKELGHPIDTHHDYVFTDWDHVEAFAEEFARVSQPAEVGAQPSSSPTA